MIRVRSQHRATRVVACLTFHPHPTDLDGPAIVGNFDQASCDFEQAGQTPRCAHTHHIHNQTHHHEPKCRISISTKFDTEEINFLTPEPQRMNLSPRLGCTITTRVKNPEIYRSGQVAFVCSKHRDQDQKTTQYFPFPSWQIPFPLAVTASRHNLPHLSWLFQSC